MNEYATFLGYELYFRGKGTSEIQYSYADFKKIVLNKLNNKEKYTTVLKIFYKEIEVKMKNMD